MEKKTHINSKPDSILNRFYTHSWIHFTIHTLEQIVETNRKASRIMGHSCYQFFLVSIENEKKREQETWVSYWKFSEFFFFSFLFRFISGCVFVPFHVFYSLPSILIGTCVFVPAIVVRRQCIFLPCQTKNNNKKHTCPRV